MMYINMNVADQPKVRKVARVASVLSLQMSSTQANSTCEHTLSKLAPCNSLPCTHHYRNSLTNKGHLKITDRESFIDELATSPTAKSGFRKSAASAKLPKLSMTGSQSPSKYWRFVFGELDITPRGDTDEVEIDDDSNQQCLTNPFVVVKDMPKPRRSKQGHNVQQFLQISGQKEDDSPVVKDTPGVNTVSVWDVMAANKS